MRKKMPRLRRGFSHFCVFFRSLFPFLFVPRRSDAAAFLGSSAVAAGILLGENVRPATPRAFARYSGNVSAASGRRRRARSRKAPGSLPADAAFQKARIPALISALFAAFLRRLDSSRRFRPRGGDSRREPANFARGENLHTARLEAVGGCWPRRKCAFASALLAQNSAFPCQGRCRPILENAQKRRKSGGEY